LTRGAPFGRPRFASGLLRHFDSGANLRLQDSRYSTLCDYERSEPDHDIALEPVAAVPRSRVGCGCWRIAIASGGDLMNQFRLWREQ
jgi:hypothetical protein